MKRGLHHQPHEYHNSHIIAVVAEPGPIPVPSECVPSLIVSRTTAGSAGMRMINAFSEKEKIDLNQMHCCIMIMTMMMIKSSDHLTPDSLLRGSSHHLESDAIRQQQRPSHASRQRLLV